MRGYRKAVNKFEQNKIRRWHEKGLSVEDISKGLLVIPEVVQNFIDYFNKDKPGTEDPPSETAQAPALEAAQETPAEETEKTEPTDIEPPKKRRGRPPKNPPT